MSVESVASFAMTGECMSASTAFILVCSVSAVLLSCQKRNNSIVCNRNTIFSLNEGDNGCSQ